jgi:hypothetical protein
MGNRFLGQEGWPSPSRQSFQRITQAKEHALQSVLYSSKDNCFLVSSDTNLSIAF